MVITPVAITVPGHVRGVHHGGVHPPEHVMFHHATVDTPTAIIHAFALRHAPVSQIARPPNRVRGHVLYQGERVLIPAHIRYVRVITQMVIVRRPAHRAVVVPRGAHAPVARDI